MSIFDYTKPDFPADCEFNISPSTIGMFFEYPSVWYKEQVLEEPKSFDGNTNSVLGTICHAIYEDYSKNGKVTLTRDIINADLRETYKDRPDIDIPYIEQTYPLVANIVMDEYLRRNKPTDSEIKLISKVKHNIYVGGTCDAYDKKTATVIDYKSVGTKPSEKSIPFGYKIQLLAYAYILKALQKPVSKIRIVYGIHPTKTIPARCLVVEELIDFPANSLINDTLTLIADSILKVKEDPSLVYLLFKSMSLK